MRRLLSIMAIGLMPAVAWGQGGCYPISVNDNQLEMVSTINGEEIPTILTFGPVPANIPMQLAEQLNKEIHEDSRTTIGSVIGGELSNRKYIEELEVNFLGVDTTFGEVTVVERETEESYLVVSLLLFRDMLLQLDFPGEKLCLSDRSGSNLREVENVEMRNEGGWGIPAVEARLNDTEDVWLIISPDFQGGVMLDNTTAEKFALSPPDELDDSLMMYQGTLDALQIGPYSLGNVSADIPVPGQENMLTTDGYRSQGASRRRTVSSNGRIGMDVLKHFVLTIDLVNTRMHIYAP